MPSPFPGMDPYLEDRALWPDIHQRMITYIIDYSQPPAVPLRDEEAAWLANLLEEKGLRTPSP